MDLNRFQHFFFFCEDINGGQKVEDIKDKGTTEDVV